MSNSENHSTRAAIGTFLFYVLSGLAAIPFLPFLPLVIIPKRYTWWIFRIYLNLQLFFLRICCGIRVRVTGRENVPDRPVLWASQHESQWETVYFQALLDNPAMFAKKEIFSYPLIGLLTHWNGHIPVDRGGSIDDMRAGLKAGVDVARQGRSILIFPSGTRDKRARGKVQSGVAVLYQLLELPVLPVRLNSATCWPPKGWIKYPGTIQVEILPAIAPGMDRRAFIEQLRKDLA
ncbi:lysophospholipid acyltransferase family protein [Shimia sp. SDUM112013]|uniref:lysophospholipid acyltransferase family protein n=1 Tax=Shimia sp. SDUM112013 TaxID=3136160 RepID=UPI0032EF782A